MARRSAPSDATPNSRGAKPSEPQRLQRLLAAAGYGSRRQCEELIASGRVLVDGETVTKLGTTVDPAVHQILVDGVVLKRQKRVYYAVNKPTGVVTTNRDPQGRPRVIDLVPPDERVFPVGRLDRSSEGLILLTNDGDLAQRLAHPRFGIQKVYRVTVAGKVDPDTMRQMRRGIYIAEGHVRVDGARILKSRARVTELEIVLREGKNREIRRVLARLGHKVQKLRRIAIGPLRLGQTPLGAYRPLTPQELRKLHEAADAAERGDLPNQQGVEQGRPDKSSSNRRRGPKKSGGRKSPAKQKSAPGETPRKGSRKSREIAVGPNTDPPSAPGAVIGGDQSSSKTPPKKRAAKKGRSPQGKQSGRPQVRGSGKVDRGKAGSGKAGSGKAGKRSTKKRKR